MLTIKDKMKTAKVQPHFMKQDLAVYKKYKALLKDLYFLRDNANNGRIADLVEDVFQKHNSLLDRNDTHNN